MSVLIYGATGFTGRLVANALSRRGIPFVLSGRDRHRLDAMASDFDEPVETRAAQVHNAANMAAAVEGNAVVINCAGPFDKLGEPVVRAAIDAGAHYIDTTGEQAFMRRVYESYESAARRAKVAVVNGCAFEIALGDWAAALAAAAFDGGDGDGTCDELFVAYAMDKFKATSGTQLSAIDSLAQDGVVWSVDRWESVRPAAERRVVQFPEPFGERSTLSFPSGEVISVPRHTRSQRVQTFISMFGESTRDSLLSRATGVLGPALPFLLRSPLLTAMKARVGQSGAGPTPVQRRDSTFAIVAEAERSLERRRVCVAGCDPYGITAEVIAYAANHLLVSERSAVGVLAPSQLIDASVGLTEIAEVCLLEVTRN